MNLTCFSANHGVGYGSTQSFTMESADVECVIRRNQLTFSFLMMEKEVIGLFYARKQRNIKEHNNATNIVTPRFVVKDLIVCKAIKPAHNLSFIWSGPSRVIDLKCPSVCLVKDQVSQKKETMHETLLQNYSRLTDGLSDSEDVRKLADRTAVSYDIVTLWVSIELMKVYGSLFSETGTQRNVISRGHI